MSPEGSGDVRPISPTNAGLKSANDARSPRQCKGSVPVNPLSDWVVIGPFMGWNGGSWGSCPGGTGSIDDAVGLPRSQAMLSMAPKTWQLPHARSPCDDEISPS